MRVILSLIISFFFLVQIYAQEKLNGNWLGVLQRAGQSLDEATPFYLTIEGTDATFSGFTREEIYDTDDYAVKQIKGEIENNSLKFQQIVISKSKRNTKIKNQQ